MADKDNPDLNPDLFLVAFVAITPQYNSLNQNSKSNMSSNNQAFTSHILTGTIL
jgi:hypothetical protein